MHTYLCQTGEEEVEIKSKHQLKAGDLIIQAMPSRIVGEKCKKFIIIEEKGVKLPPIKYNKENIAYGKYLIERALMLFNHKCPPIILDEE